MTERLLYSPSDAAEAISVSRSTLYKMLGEHRIRYVVVNQRIRIPGSELDRIAEEGAPSFGTPAPEEAAVAAR